jgi:3-oxoacyl-[acyl-carrier protein] reductase
MDKNSWVVVTGGGGAIGSALAQHCALDYGCRVLALDRHFDSSLNPSKSVISREIDLVNEAEVRDTLASVIMPGDVISVLINAVGMIWNEPIVGFQGGKLKTHSLESWRNVIDANLTASFVAATQVAARMVRQRYGSIINFSSVASNGNAGQAAYSAAKAGVEGFTRTLASELGPLGIRVNAIALGFIDVKTTRDAVGSNKLKHYQDKTPLGRLGSVQDVMGAINFLATNSFINGTILGIDGGLRL